MTNTKSDHQMAVLHNTQGEEKQKHIQLITSSEEMNMVEAEQQ